MPKNTTASIVVGFFGALLMQFPASGSTYQCAIVGNEWQILSRHVVGSIEYISIGPSGMPYEIGTGLFLLGRPRGERKNAVGTSKITAYGAGGLFARSKNGTLIKVCATSDGFSPITIIHREF